MSKAEHVYSEGGLDTSRVKLRWMETPWDSAVFNFPVIQINEFEIKADGADEDLASFELIRDKTGVGLVSCRIPCEKLRESMLLEAQGFRFVEMLFQPELDSLQISVQKMESELTVALASVGDLPEIESIAGNAFYNERFHVDPRLTPSLGNQRYKNWVRSSLAHNSQRLFIVRDGQQLISFFVTEMLADGTCYWHLNAIAPKLQGQGYGKRVWQLMIQKAAEDGAVRIRTSIVARNHRVLNLYAKLGFRFPSPLMTFHWVRDSSS